MKKLVIIILLAVTGLSNQVFAVTKVNNYQQIDTLKMDLNDSVSKSIDLRTDFLTNIEIEHQKLIRNIFITGFLVILGFLIFTIFFYGNKIKKVSNLILLQNDAINSSKDQLIKVINVFNYIDQQIFITDSKGNIEWLNSYASKWFTEDFETNKCCLLSKFKTESQGIIFQGINDDKPVFFKDNLFGKDLELKMIPVKNSKGEFSNMFFIGA